MSVRSNNNSEGLKYEWILMFYIAIKPLYIFSSGGMQISDIFLALSFGWLLLHSRHGIDIPPEGKKWFRDVLLFTIYVSVVNAFWYVWLIDAPYKSSTFISSILYYIFNALAVILTLNIVYRIGIDRVIIGVMNGTTISSLIVLLGIILNLGKGERNTSFFNNPNQLGFYAIILLTLLCFFHDFLDKKKAMVIIVSSVIATIVSLSKASFISMFALGFFVLISNKSNRPKQLFKKCGAIIILGVSLYVLLFGNISFVNDNIVLRELRDRVVHMSQENDSNLGTGRGYDRVYEMGKNLLWGMGEGGYDRFTIMRGFEIHSTYANILVSYGLIGSFLALGVFLFPLKSNRSFFRNLCCMSGIILYGISHNGIRNTLVWIVLACLIVQNNQNRLLSDEKLRNSPD